MRLCKTSLKSLKHEGRECYGNGNHNEKERAMIEKRDKETMKLFTLLFGHILIRIVSYINRKTSS